MTIRSPARRDHHDLGGRRRTCWAARSRSARSCSRSPRPSGDWVLEVEVPDDDMGPVLAAQSKLEAEIARGQEAARRDAAGLLRDGDRPRAPLPGLRPADRLQGRDGRDTKHVVKVTVGFSDDGPQGLPVAEPGAPARGRGPGPGRLRRGQAGLRAAPRRRPGLATRRSCSAGRSCIERSPRSRPSPPVEPPLAPDLDSGSAVDDPSNT